MTRKQLQTLLREKGVVGAGGAGFPTYAKLNGPMDTVIVNGAECEPLIQADKGLLEMFPFEIGSALETVVKTIGAKKGVVATKKSYAYALAKLENHLPASKKLEIKKLDDVYPAGDEIIMTYQVTGRIVPQGGVPSAAGVAVFNVETMYNMYRAVFEDKPVTHKWLTVAGVMPHAVTLRVPIGVSLRDVITAAGSGIPEDCAILVGGPMTGRLADPDAPVTKTTKAILVLPNRSPSILIRQRALKNDMRRALSVCSQCRMCTDLCPRALLGYDTAPHDLMRRVVNNDATYTAAYTNALYCADCGLCEMYACHQGLSPRKLNMAVKSALRESGVRPDSTEKKHTPHPFLNERRVPDQRLIARLGLVAYADVKPMYRQEPYPFTTVMLTLEQPSQKACLPVITEGEQVHEGQLIAKPPESGYGTPIHASITGCAVEVNNRYIRLVIQNDKEVCHG